ncbi:hypothetical protein P4S73_02905 [Paraglaciecola sp. Hal342]
MDSTEEQAKKAQGVATDSPRVGDGKCTARLGPISEADGFIKLVVEKAGGRLIGAQILAHEGGELIQGTL